MVKMKRREGLWNLVDPLSRFRDTVDLARPRSETKKKTSNIPRWLAPLFFPSTHTDRILHGFNLFLIPPPIARLVAPRSFDLDTVFSLSSLSFTPLPLVVCLYVFCEHTQKWTHVLSSSLFPHLLSFRHAYVYIYQPRPLPLFSHFSSFFAFFLVFRFFFAFFSPTPSIPAAQPSHLSSSSTSPFLVV